MNCLKMGNDHKRLIRACLPEDTVLIASRLTITGLKSLAKLLVRNLRVSKSQF